MSTVYKRGDYRRAQEKAWEMLKRATSYFPPAEAEVRRNLELYGIPVTSGGFRGVGRKELPSCLQDVLDTIPDHHPLEVHIKPDISGEHYDFSWYLLQYDTRLRRWRRVKDIEAERGQTEW